MKKSDILKNKKLLDAIRVDDGFVAADNSANSASFSFKQNPHFSVVAKKEWPDHGIYFVTCSKLSLGRSDEEMVSLALRGGVKIIQYREKVEDIFFSKKSLENMAETPLLDDECRRYRLKKAHALRKLTQNYGAFFIINDDIALALAVQADGVHLGQTDISVPQARNLSGVLFDEGTEEEGFSSSCMTGVQTTFSNLYDEAEKTPRRLIVGKSTHNVAEVRKAVQEDVDYINIGPIFDTKTKENNYSSLGIVGLKECMNALAEINLELGKRIPFSVMGGIKKKHLPELASLGCRYVAMVSEITLQADVKSHARFLEEELKKHLSVKV